MAGNWNVLEWLGTGMFPHIWHLSWDDSQVGLGWPVDPGSTHGLSLGPRLPQLVGSQGPCPHEHPQTRAERPAWKVTLLPVLCGSKRSHAHLDPRQEATGPTPGGHTKSRGHHFKLPVPGTQRWRHGGLHWGSRNQAPSAPVL